MMTLAEVRLLEDRRVAAIRLTIASLLSELAKLEDARRERMRNGVSLLTCTDSLESGMAES